MTVRERLSPRGIGVALVLVLVAVAAVVWTVLDAHREKDSETGATNSLASGPAPFETGRLRFGDPNAPNTLIIVEDYQCPLCKSLDQVSGAAIDTAVKGGKTVVEYDIVAVLDTESTTEYSSRAANASTCVAVADKEKWRAYRARLFQQQPATGSGGLSDEELIDLARQVGITDPGLNDCVTARRFRDFVTAHTKADVAAGLPRVPMVFANGTEVISPTPQGITDALNR